MKIQLSTRKFMVGCGALVLMLICAYINRVYTDSYQSIEEWCKNISFYIIVLFALQMVILKIILPPKRVFMYVVVILFYVFHFSHVFLQGINYDFGTNTRNNMFFRFPNGITIEATHVMINAVIALFCGYIIYHMFHQRKKANYKDLYGGKTSISMAWILTIVGFCADIFYSGWLLVTVMMGGYNNVRDVLVSSNETYLLRLLSYLMLPGVLLFIQSKDISKQMKKVILVAFVIYKVIMSFSGLRAYVLINIFIAVYIYYRNNMEQKFRLRYLLYAGLIMQLGGGFIVGIRESRGAGINLALVMRYMFDFRSNIIFDLMSEFGITGNVICVVLSQTSGVASSGTQLVYSFLTMIPFISKIAPGINFKEAILETSLNIHNYGGSYVGDALFDFGKAGLFVACIILGLVFAKVYEWYEKNIEVGNVLNVAIMAPIIVELVFSVRSSLSKMPRMILWYAILVGIFAFSIDTLRKRVRI